MTSEGAQIMKVFLAGATGAIGRALVPQLIAAGHTVTGTTRRQAGADQLRAQGAEAVIVDPFDKAALTTAVVDARPTAVIHQLTALSDMGNLRNPDKVFATTNRMRTETTDVLIAAAQEAGAKRFIAQSFAGWPAERTGGPVKTEDDPFATEPPPHMKETQTAIRYVEEATVAAGGIALRYGGFYGPGTGMAPGAEQVKMVQGRKFPVVGSGAGVWSFVHIDDAAAATVLALEHGKPGVYNVVDDEPAPVAEWLPLLAQVTGAKPPRHVPTWLGKLAAGPALTAMMTEIRGASNAKAKRELGWQPAHPSWRTGFAEVMAA
jgi:2-alkyl-3-oxoalkanoate reductase